MGQSCEDIKEEIGQSIAGELSSGVHEHIKSCKDCDNYAQKIIRLEKVFRDEGVFNELRERTSFRSRSEKRRLDRAAGRRRWLKKIDKLKEQGRWPND